MTSGKGMKKIYVKKGYSKADTRSPHLLPVYELNRFAISVFK